MIPSSALCRLASRAVKVFDMAPTTASPLSSSAHDFPQLVSCTRALVLLTKTRSESAADAHIVQCLQRCADHTLTTLRQFPATADVAPDVAVVLFGILRSSVGFWEAERSAQLAQQLNERVDALVLRTWRPRVLLAAVHAIAKACPSQAHLSFLRDALALLHHQEAQLSERDVATLLWCMAVLRVAETQERMWASLCKRAAFHLTRMNAVSRLTLSQALLLQHTCLCESQAELLRAVHEVNCEIERVGAAQGKLHQSGSQRGDRRGRRSAHFYAVSNTRNSRTDAPSQLTSQLLQYTTHSLSDEALVRLLLTLFTSGARAAAEEELPLVLAHLTQRTSLSERLCLQVLCFAQRYASLMGDRATTPSSDAHALLSSSTASSSKVSELVRGARQHVAQLLLQSARTGLARAPREVAEALCLEHHYYSCRGSSGPSTPTRVSKEALSADAVWEVIVAVLSKTFSGGSTALHSLDGAELWSWQCTRAYVRSVQDASAHTGNSPEASATQKDEPLKLDRLDLYSDVQRCWTNARERQAHCAELIAASAQSGGTQLLAYASGLHSSTALRLLETTVEEVQVGVRALSVATTLRLLSAVDEAPAVVLPLLHLLRPPLLSQLETHTSRTSGALAEVIRYLSNARSLGSGGLGSDGGGAGARLSAHPRVSDAVLDAYVRLLAQEGQHPLPPVQASLLLWCLQERQRRPAALESALMILMTRRLGQSAPFLSAASLPIEAMCNLVELANGLPLAQGDATATATRTVILTTVLDHLVQRCIPACTTADGLVAAGLLLRLDVIGEFQRVSEMAAALDRRGAELLLKGSAEWTPTQKAYLIAALVCAQAAPSEELLRALHSKDHVGTSISFAEEETETLTRKKSVAP
ncbi:hypothetical protein ABB37_08679 [Leptomonas pyrrhocoris]|uniref:Uncharacterized protein n=1 Tax=Leptomonas pyrrhocoris TaxID=157538 RepID=A0A0M9FT47_LEPPY|nr:hypothetical protein ABB37_08679 [Leptomonas pyrrhocoris]KPA75409.1 hypothetical protein ABB37_08679 [Leptomonas pyrrhocoris]|eukprot:XP_015653848.1 hypothetical protein ABB37_08679 [Leptomonas pyrrhocoris]